MFCLQWVKGCLVAAMMFGFSSVLEAHPGHDGHGHHGHAHNHDDGKKKEPDVLAFAPFQPAEEESKLEIDGQGDWRFRYCPELSRVPVDAAVLNEAHGGFAVNRRAKFGFEETYFALPKVGLIKISPDLQEMKVIGGDGKIFNGQTNPKAAINYHNCVPVYNGDELHLGLPSNNAHKVWIVKPDGTLVNTFGAPPNASGRGPTDLWQLPKSQNIRVTYGYGDNHQYDADPFAGDFGVGVWNPGRYGGRGPRTKLGVFSTPHGGAMWPGGEFIAIADRGYGRIQKVTLDGKPEGVWDLKVPGTEDKAKQWPNPCDVDFSPDGKYALVGNLNGIGGSTSTFQIFEVATGKLLSTVTPAKLGVPNSRHIHNAVFRYVDDRGIYVLCLFWSPGGYGVFELVQ